jgi:RecA-family ATPase
MDTPENIPSFIVDDPAKIHGVVAGDIKLPPPPRPARKRAQPGTGGTDASGPPAHTPEDRTMWQLVKSVNLDKNPDVLLKPRYLGRGGGLLLVGPTGIGKSTLAMQCAILWALGEPAFGIEPSANLKSLIIQAENDDFDMAQMFNDVCDAQKLEGADRECAGENIIVVREDATTGEGFWLHVVRPMLAKHQPHLLWIDPALAYLGAESNSQKDVGHFLRNRLNPLLREFHCGAVVLHHTNKPPSGKDASNWSNSEYAYAGGGSAEWANWSRAVLVVRPIRGSSFFELVAAKRGGHIGWIDSA